MPFFDFFRNLFNRGSVPEPPEKRCEDNCQHRDSFRNPIWQNDDDEDDVNDFSRHSMDRYNFRVDSNPFEITRFFESQMDHLLKSFFTFDGFGNNLEFGNIKTIPIEDDDFTNGFFNPNGNSSKKGPRDEVMKPEFETPKKRFLFDDFTNIFALPDAKPSDKRLCDDLLKPSYEMPASNSQKVDSDIDGKIQSDELTKIWKNPSTPSAVEPQYSFKNFHFGKSVSTQIIRRQDGSFEERRTVKDSNGNEETSVTRQIGDKKHTVIKKKANDGSEEKTENIINMDENELNGFEEKWFGYSKTPKEPLNNFEQDFPWHKFFSPNPKL